MTTSPHPARQELERLFTQACSLHETGYLSEALTAYKHLLNHIPDSPLLHFNCGLVLFETGDFSAAEDHYHQAVQAQPQDPDIHYNRGLNFRRLGDLNEAVASFEEAINLGDNSVDTLYNMALSYQEQEAYQEAGRLYDTILATRPEHLSSLNNYAFLCHKTGNNTEAERLYRQLLQYNPQHTAAQHMLDSLRGNTPDTAPLEYIESIFDNYALVFEESLLHKLHYRTPESLRDLYCSHYPNDKRSHCLDLGCGTGLAGAQLNPYCKQLTGVDISEEMLTVARGKEFYQELYKDDILSFLANTTNSYDLIVAADVFTYMGDLEEIFKWCASRASDQALFLFSVEDSAIEPYRLKGSGRFGHSSTYIQTLSNRHSWRMICCKDSVLRQDKGKPVEGRLFLLRKESTQE